MLLVLAIILVVMSFLPIGPQHALIRGQVARILATQTHRDVRVGRFSRSLWRGLVIDGLAIASEGGMEAAPPVVDIDTISIRWSLIGLLLHLKNPLGAVNSIRADGVEVTLRRTPDGVWELVKLFQPETPKPKKPFTYGGSFDVIDGHVRLIDEAIPGRTVERQLDQIEAHLNFNGRGEASMHASLTAPGLADQVELSDGHLQLEPVNFGGQVAVDGLRIGTAGEIANRFIKQWVQLDAGTVTKLTGRFQFAAGEHGPAAAPNGTAEQAATPEAQPSQAPPADLGLDLRAELDGVGVTVKALGEPLESLTGQARIVLQTSSEGGPGPGDVVSLDSVAVRIGSSRATVQGTLSDYRNKPHFDLQVLSRGWNVAETERLLPKIKVLHNLADSGVSTFNLRLTNGLDDLRIAGDVQPVKLHWGDLATLDGGKLEIDLRRVPKSDGLAGLLGGLELTEVAAATKFLARPVQRIYGGVRFGKDAIGLQNIHARIDGAPLMVSGTITELTKPGRVLDLKVETQGLTPAVAGPLLPPKLRPAEVRGGITADLVIQGPVKALKIAGSATLPWFRTAQLTHLGGRYGLDLQLGDRPTGRISIADAGVSVARLGGPVTDVNGVVRLQPAALMLDDLRARWAGGPVRADGRVALQGGSHDLRVWTPGLEAAQVAGVIGRRDIQGRGRLAMDLRLQGTPQRLQVSGTAQVPWLRVPQATIAQADLRLDLAVEPRRGLFGLQGVVTARKTRVKADALDAMVAVDQGTVRFDHGSLQLADVRGTINDDRFRASGGLRFAGGRRVRLASVDLAVRADKLRPVTVRRVAGELDVWDKLALTAPVSADLRLAGPLDRLHITGGADVGGATVKQDPPLPLAATVRLDLRLRPKAMPIGTIRIASGHAYLQSLSLAVPEMAGLVTFTEDQKIALGNGPDEPFQAMIGGSRVGVSGTVEPGDPTRLALMVNADAVRLEDVRTLAGTMDHPPELEGDETIGAFRLLLAGPLDHLRIATIGPAGETAAMIPLPDRLSVAGYTVAGGLAGIDVTLGEKGLDAGEVLFQDVALDVASTGTHGVINGSIGILDGRPNADLTALIDGRPIRVAGRTKENDELAFRIRADDVPILGLLPQQASLDDALETDRLSTDLVIAGPLDDLAVAGTMALGGYQDLAPAAAEVHLRLVKPLDDPAATEPQPTQVLGGVRLVGGGIKLASLDDPITQLAGSIDVALDTLRLDDLSATVDGSTITVNGSVDLGEEPMLDLDVAVPGLDVASLLQDLNRPPKDDPEGEPVGFFESLGLPLLHTPEPLSGTLSVSGPLSQVAVGLDLKLPLVVVDDVDAMPPGPTPQYDKVADGRVLLKDATITGTAIGSLRSAAAAVPSGEELAGALNKLAGITLVAMPAEPEPEPEPEPDASPLDSFVLGLTLHSAQLNPRQGFAFLSSEAQAGILGEAYAFQPGQGTLEITGPLKDLRFRGDFDLQRVELQDVPIRRLAAKFDYFDHLMTLDQVLLDVRGGEVTGHGAMALRADLPLDIAMELDIDRVEMAVLNRLQLFGDRDLELEGEVNGTVQLHLSNEVPKIQGALRLDGLQVVGESVGDGVVDFAVEKDLLVLRQVELIEPVGRSHARVKGRVGLNDDGVLDLLVDVRNLDLGRLAPLFSDPAKPAVTGRLDLVGAVTGNRQLPMVAGSGNIFFGSVAGMPFNRLSVRAVETGSDSLQLTGELSDAAYQATLTADLTDLNPQEGTLRYVVDADIDSVELAQALPQAGVPGDDSYGRVTGTAHFTGRVAKQTTESGETKLNPLLDLQGQADLSAGDPERPGRLVVAGVQLDSAALKLTAENDRVDVQALEVNLGSTRIGIDPELTNAVSDLSNDARVELHLVSDELRVEDLVSLTKLPLQTDGSLQVAVDVTGELRDPVADVRLETHEFALQGEYIGNRAVRATVARRVAVIDGQQQFDLFGTRIVFAGSLQDESVDARGSLEIHDFNKLRAFLTTLTEPVGERRRMAWQDGLRRQLASLPADLAGTPRVEARLVGTRERPTGYVVASARDLHAGPRPVPPVELMVNIGIPTPRQPDRLEDGVLYVYGSASLGEQGALRLQARTNDLDLAPYGAWSEKLNGLHGNLSLVAQAIGSTAEPRFELQRLDLTEVGVKQVSLASFGVQSLVFRNGLLDLGTIAVDDGSLHAQLTGTIPVYNLSLRARRRSPMALKLQANVDHLAEFAGLVGAVQAVDGSAQATLDVGGTPSALTLDGNVDLDLPELVLAKPLEDFEPLHRAALAGPYQSLAAATAELAEPAPNRKVYVRLVDNAVRLKITDNTIAVEQFAFNSPPTNPDEPGTAGSLRIARGGSIALPQPLDLSRLAQEGVMSRPVSLNLAANNIAGRAGTVQWSQVQANVAITPEFSDGVMNTVSISDTGGWINGGYVTIGGEVKQRSASLANWWEQEYALRVRTPPIDPASRSVPDNAAPPEWVDEGAIYPLAVDQRGIAAAKAIADVRLETRAGQTPPLTLAGDVEIFDATVREGMLALFAAPKKEGGPPNWPATPELDLTITAQRNNWVRAKVPELQVPVSGRLRLTQTPQQLKVEGSAQLGEGQLNSSFLKNRIAIRGGDAQFVVRRNRFSGAFEPFAGFNARAETILTQSLGGGDVQRYDVSLDVHGSARPGTDKPVETDVTVKADSSPPLAEERIFAMLSRKAEFASALESGEIKGFLRQELTNAALQTALSYALTPVFDELRQALGLDVFTIRYELDRPLEIQASKYLLKRLLVTLFVEVGGPEGTKQTVKVDYEVAGGFRFGVQVDTDQEFRMTGEYSTRF